MASDENETRPSVFNFPKVELHCHLDGCFRVPTVIEIAKKRHVNLPSYDVEELKKHICITSRCPSLAVYLNPFFIIEPVFAGDADAIARLTRETIEDKAKNGVTYLELRFSPHFLANCDVDPVVFAPERGTLRPSDVVEVVANAAKEAAEKHSMKIGLILCDIVDHGEQNWGMQTVQLCKEFENRGVVGFDIAGVESVSEYDDTDLIKAFEYCKQNGIHRTAHAGEDGPAKDVENAVEKLFAERIGHGYRVVQDEAIYQMTKERGIHFEVCPISSYLTSGAPADWNLHPAIRFMKESVNFSLSTDDPGLQLTTLTDDYNIAATKWNFSVNDLKKLNLNAARSCFLNDSDRKQLISDLKASYYTSTEN